MTENRGEEPFPLNVVGTHIIRLALLPREIGRRTLGIYYVPGKGQYATEKIARGSMDEGDELYRFDITRIK